MTGIFNFSLQYNSQNQAIFLAGKRLDYQQDTHCCLMQREVTLHIVEIQVA